MIIDGFNLNLLRIFTVVYQTLNMSEASKILFMSQSAVSQNIKNLEEVLEMKLFDRLTRGLIPTPKAEVLYKACSFNLSCIEDVLSKLTLTGKSLSGTVKIGLPPEYGNNIVLPHLARWGKLHPQIHFHVKYALSSSMKTQILQGEIDFAIIDGIEMDKELKIIHITQEELRLCATKKYLASMGEIKYIHKFFEKLDYIDYAEHSPVLKAWFKHHLKFQNFNPSVRASLMNVQGVAQMVVGDLGAAVLPSHLLGKINKDCDLYIFKDIKSPLLNSLGLGFLEGRSFSTACLETRKYLVKCLKSK